MSYTLPLKGASRRELEATRFEPYMFQTLPYLRPVRDEIVFDCVCEKKTQTSNISPTKFGEPISFEFCTETQVHDVII